jgi:hypothetical protein
MDAEFYKTKNLVRKLSGIRKKSKTPVAEVADSAEAEQEQETATAKQADAEDEDGEVDAEDEFEEETPLAPLVPLQTSSRSRINTSVGRTRGRSNTGFGDVKTMDTRQRMNTLGSEDRPRARSRINTDYDGSNPDATEKLQVKGPLSWATFRFIAKKKGKLNTGWKQRAFEFDCNLRHIRYYTMKGAYEQKKD